MEYQWYDTNTTIRKKDRCSCKDAAISTSFRLGCSVLEQRIGYSGYEVTERQTKLRFKRLQSGMNILPMMQEVGENFDDFYKETYRQDNIQCQKETMSINLVKGVRYDDGTHFDDTHTTVETAQFDKYAKVKEFLNWFTNTYGGRMYRVAIVHLGSEKKVYPHIDGGKYYEDKDRFHMVLSGYYDYTVEDETVRFNAGDLWWFDNQRMHHAVNATPISRICIIFDVKGSNFK